MDDEVIKYLVPANSKRGLLIFSMFRAVDLIILVVGVAITILLVAIFSPNNIILTLLVIMPGLISITLVTPIPNYHNVMNLLFSVYGFFSERRIYYWKGWCAKNESENK